METTPSPRRTCAHDADDVILYSVLRGPRLGDVLCGPCVMDAGGSKILHPRTDEPDQAQHQPRRFPAVPYLRLVQTPSAPVALAIDNPSPPRPRKWQTLADD